MKNIRSLFIFFLALPTFMIGQGAGLGGPRFTASSATPCTGEEFCVDITVEDFTDITAVKFPILFDTSVIEFIGLSDLNMPGLDESDFDVTAAEDGLIKLNWLFADCESATSAVTLPDNQVIFKLCFRAIADYGEFTFLDILDEAFFEDDPQPIFVERLSVCGINIGLRDVDGVISTCVRPLELSLTSAQGNTGELISVDVKVSGFTNMSSLQFSLIWDSTFMKFESVIPLENLENLNASNFGTPLNSQNVPEGRINFSWAFGENEDGITLEDDISIFTLNFRITGECETTKPIDFGTDDIAEREAVITRKDENGVGFFNVIPILTTPGEVATGACEPTGLLVTADCGAPVNLNDEICVSVTAGAISDINTINYLMKWNSSILEFVRIQSLNGTAIPGITLSDFNTSNAVNGGILEFDWRSAGPFFNANFSEEEQMYEVCFKVVGLGGNSPVQFDPNRQSATVRQEGNINDIGIFPSNCEVVVNQPEGVSVSLTSGQNPPGDTVKIDVTAANFANLLSLQFSLSWEPNHASYVAVQDIHPTLVDSTNIGEAGSESGSLTFKWSNEANATSIPNDEKLFTLCLLVTGDTPGELAQEKNCQEIALVDFPLEGEAISANSNGNNIGVTPVNGEICVLNPDGYFVVIENKDAFRNTVTCVDFKVAEFDSITSTQFALNWDPTQLQFSGDINLDAIPDLAFGTNLDTSSAAVGIINFDWSTEDITTGLSLPDSAILFEVCFELIGNANDCTNIELNGDPNPSVTTATGVGSVFPIGGSVCIKDTIIIVDSLITAVTCPDGNDGTIELTVDGGTGPIFYNWRAINSTQFLPKAVNLPVGRVAVTVFDNSLPPLITRDTFDIPLTDDLPFSVAGEDQVLNCESQAVILNGSGSEGDKYQYRWIAISGSLDGATTGPVSVATQAGRYAFSVLNTETGCTARDTMEVFRPDVPDANAGQNVFFTCADSLKQLDASNSTPLDTNVVYEWRAFSGGLIAPGDEMNVTNPTITTPGTYVLEVRYTNTGCFSTDTVQAISVQEFTPVSAGPDRELNCDTAGILIIGDIDNSVRDFNFEWFDEMGTQIATDERVTVNTPGLYVIRATDADNFCATTDTLLVTPSSSIPTITQLDTTAIDCNNPTVDLSATVENTSNFTIDWSSFDGGLIETNEEQPLNPTITGAGTFVLTVVDTATSCAQTDTVTVLNNIEILSIDAGEGGEITCEAPSITLRASVDTAFQLEWTLDGNTQASNSDTLLATAPGTYYLQVTNLNTGCSNRDSVIVTASTDFPELNVASIPTITCNQTEVSFTAEVLPADANYDISWSPVNGGQIIGDTNSLLLTVGSAGIYNIQVTNQQTGCTSALDIEIPTDTLSPLAEAGADMVLTCSQSSILLDGTGSEQGSNISYLWTAVEGGSTPSPDTAIQATITAPGTYMLEVRNLMTGCSATDMVMVTPDTALPTVQLAEAAELSCTMNMVTLDGTGSDSGTGFTVEWNPLDGQGAPQIDTDPLMAVVTDAGNYELLITNSTTGCMSSATILVEESRDLPEASAGADIIVTCPGNSFSLDGSLSSQGSNFTYSWSSINGVDIINPTSLAPSITQPGQFEIVVTNINNGCTSSDIVEALLDPNLAEADAGADDSSCEGTAAIFAVAPLNATGIWNSVGAAIVDIPDGNSSTVENLQPGANIFVWTLSTADCPSYSSDSVTVIREEAPLANADAVELEVGTTELTFNVVANDIVTAASGATVKIIEGPGMGLLGPDVANGSITYQVANGIFGEDNFTYEICNSECISLCDTTLVSVTVPFDPNYTPTLANGITPNGDGMNDELRFEALEVDPDAFPDNELIIFNRWGDIVFQAKPYNNNWQGTNSSGQELPQGTYYYILRLDISEGNIVKGDVTIVK